MNFTVDKQEKYDKPTKKSNTSTPQLTPIKKSAINKPKPVINKGQYPVDVIVPYIPTPQKSESKQEKLQRIS